MGRYLLARSCVIPDEAFDTLEALAARVAELTRGRPSRFRSGAVARGPAREAGVCVAISTAWATAFEHVGYAFMPGTLSGNEAALKAAVDRAITAHRRVVPLFEEVTLSGGVGLAFVAERAAA